MSEGERMLAMLRCTNTSPGFRPRMVVSGIRESAQPIQRIRGDWEVLRVGRKGGSFCRRVEAQRLFRVRAWWKKEVESVGEAPGRDC